MSEYQGNRGIRWVMTITDDGTKLPYDLTGCTVLMRLTKRGEKVHAIEELCHIPDPPTGEVVTVFSADDLDLEAGWYCREYIVSDGAGLLVTVRSKEPEVAIRRSLFYEQ